MTTDNYTEQPLNREEQRELCRLRDAGDDSATWRLAQSVFPLARRLTVEYCRASGWDDFDAAYSAACRGAHRAATKLDPQIASITTYSHAWIRQFLHRERELLCGGVIWVPPTAGESGYADDAERAKRVGRFCSMGNYDNDGDYEPSVDNCPQEDAAGRELEALDKTRIEAVLAQLPPRMAAVLRMRFFDGKTLERCGQSLGVSKERVRQIEAKAIAKFRAAWVNLPPTLNPQDAPMNGENPRSVTELIDALTPEAIHKEMRELESQFAMLSENYKAKKAKLNGLLKALGAAPVRASGGRRGRRQAMPREGSMMRDAWNELREAGPLSCSDLALRLQTDKHKLSCTLSQGKGRYWSKDGGKYAAIVPEENAA